jgi:hypothetical protein
MSVGLTASEDSEAEGEGEGADGELAVQPDNIVDAELVPSLTTTRQSAGAAKSLRSIRKFPEPSDMAEACPPLTVTVVFGVAPRPSTRSFDPLSSALVIDTAASAEAASTGDQQQAHCIRRHERANPSHRPLLTGTSTCPCPPAETATTGRSARITLSWWAAATTSDIHAGLYPAHRGCTGLAQRPEPSSRTAW